MDDPTYKPLLLPQALVAEIESVAALEERPTKEMLQDAVELYLRERRPVAKSVPGTLTPAEAARRMLERRKFHPLPAGETIRDMMINGRA